LWGHLLTPPPVDRGSGTDPLHIVAFAYASSAHEIMTGLLDRAGELTNELDVSGSAAWQEDDHSEY
jgi:hypothetical protein